MRMLRGWGGAALLAAGLLVTSTVRAADDPPPAQAPDPLPVPPGSPEDQALWRVALESGTRMAVARATAAKLQWRARSGDYEKRLAEAAVGASDAERKRLAEAGRRVTAAWAASSELLAERWPVDPTRGCQYPAQLLESAMHAAASGAKGGELGQARADVAGCVEKARLVLARVDASNGELEQAIAGGDAALASVAAGPAPGAGAGATTPPAAR